MAAALVNAFKGPVKAPHPISWLELIPSGGGVFDVAVDGNLVFSKHKLKRHAEPQEVIDAIRQMQSKL